ncbi:dethiobiotin synthetase [Helicobacter bizzozeronii CIII-1]|uniref:ATP-dependent dethiobiotin synthetase BioD n=1 Tax=Helicobacter bizzozeronii (strain CIII-1) TaxID=1002804 RepID=F8KQ30_HELBC|nr:dethiobiotin synthase [Helicobacter bizzozeronii]CCB79511.1 dethiobiotin synthetase [Helicobacter bizzozeronii CIII-1]
MYAPIFVSATNTEIGKTTIAKELAGLYNNKGIKTLLAKPIETGINAKQEHSDGAIFLEENLKIDSTLELSDISFYRYVLGASPFVAARFEPHLPPIDFKVIEHKLDKLQKHCDLLIIEGVGGLLVPLDEKTKVVDLVLHLKAKLLLVASDRLGTLNDLLLNHNYLIAHKIPCHTTINMQDKRLYYQINKPFIDHYNATLKEPISIFQEHAPILLDRLLA